jgi:hypothetical protein
MLHIYTVFDIEKLPLAFDAILNLLKLQQPDRGRIELQIPQASST